MSDKLERNAMLRQLKTCVKVDLVSVGRFFENFRDFNFTF